MKHLLNVSIFSPGCDLILWDLVYTIAKWKSVNRCHPLYDHPLLTLTGCAVSDDGAELICLRIRLSVLGRTVSAEGDLACGCKVQPECSASLTSVDCQGHMMTSGLQPQSEHCRLCAAIQANILLLTNLPEYKRWGKTWPANSAHVCLLLSIYPK